MRSCLIADGHFISEIHTWTGTKSIMAGVTIGLSGGFKRAGIGADATQTPDFEISQTFT